MHARTQAHFQTLTKKDRRWISTHERMAGSPVSIEILLILDASATVLYIQRQQLVLVGGVPFFGAIQKNEWFAGWGGGCLALMLVTEVHVLSQAHRGCFSFFNLMWDDLVGRAIFLCLRLIISGFRSNKCQGLIFITEGTLWVVVGCKLRDHCPLTGENVTTGCVVV